MSYSPDSSHGSKAEKETIPTEVVTSEIGTDSDLSEKTAVANDLSSKTSTQTLAKDLEKLKTPIYVTDVAAGDDVVTAEEDAALRELPLHVRRIVNLHDDPTLPTITFRFFLLTLIFVPPGAFLNQLSMFRTTSAPYSIFFVQIAASYAGDWLAKIIPAFEVKVPFTKYSFNLNPGPFSVKEHVLVVIAAASGATYNLAWSPLSLAELYFKDKINPAIWIFFMWAIVWTGYSYAAVARQFLIYDPQQPWFHALCQTALFESQTKQREHPSPVSRKQMMVFFITIFAVAVWEFLPEFVFPFLSSLALLCWVAPQNPVANFVGSGIGGMGFLNLSLDWSNVGNIDGMGNFFVTPWYTQVICFLAFVVNCWILIPWSKYGGLGIWRHQLMSNRLYLETGEEYPFQALITPEATLNETAYAQLGPPFVGAQYLWNTFFDYASYTSVLTWMALFGYPYIKVIWTKYLERRKFRRLRVNDQYPDPLNVIMRSYDEVPLWWYIVLFLTSFIIILTILSMGYLYIPLWTYFVALATGAVTVIPLGWLFAVSNFQLPVGTTNELLYGLMVNGVSGYKNPVGASVYSSIAGDAWYRAQILLQDQKLGHYMHIPPRAVFFAQILGSFIGVPLNYAVIRWVLDKKGDYLTGVARDPTGQWSGQTISNYLAISTQYVLIGPIRLFHVDLYNPLPYGFILGAFTPLIIYLLARCFPKANFHLWNCTIFFCALSNFYGTISTGYLSSIIGGFVVMYWAYRHHYELWARYNYILSAAFDTGFNLMLLIAFLSFSLAKTVNMPNWWGNNMQSVERCFVMPAEAYE